MTTKFNLLLIALALVTLTSCKNSPSTTTDIGTFKVAILYPNGIDMDYYEKNTYAHGSRILR